MKIIKYIFLLIVLIIFHIQLSCQVKYSDIFELMKDTSIRQFSEIQKIGNNYYAGKEKGRGSGYKQWKRWEYDMSSHLTPDGKITNYAARNMQAFKQYFGDFNKAKSDNSETTHGAWESMNKSYYVNATYGYTPGMGRVLCIAFHPTDQYTFYVGTPSGGLWKTNNGGGSWTCLTDGMPAIGVSGIAIHPVNTDIIYILTGDGDSDDCPSIGVMKTINGGVNWYQTGLQFNSDQLRRGYKLSMHPTNPDILFAATTNGLWKTINAGDTWTNNLPDKWVYDFEFKPGDPTIMYCSVGTSKFFRSTNSGNSWSQITSGIPTNSNRFAIGVSQASPSSVYLLCGRATGVGSFAGFYLSTNSGQSFNLRSSTPNILGYESNGQDDKDQSTFDLAIVVSDSQSNSLIIGGINSWISNDGGVTWTISSYWYKSNNSIGYTHADIHALERNPLNNFIYCGSDGGIYKTINFGDTWEDVSGGLEISQYYRIGGSESDVNLIIGGSQDLGFNKYDTSLYMKHMKGGDGMECIIDHGDPLIYYCFTSNGEYLLKTYNGGNLFVEKQPNMGPGPWVTPLIMDHTNSSILYAGYIDVMKTTNGGSDWTNMGADGRKGMALGKNNPNRVYAVSDSAIYMSDNAGTSWTTYGLPIKEPTYITVDPVNSLHIYITYPGYNDGNKVFESWNGGVSWTNISGTLPNVPIQCIAYEEGSAGGVYIGTDIGVFYRDNNISDWIPFSNGLPTVPVRDLDIHYTSGTIRVGTHGRGIWSSELYSSCPSYYYLNQINDPSNPNFTGCQYYEADSYISSSRIITGGLGSDVTYKSNGDVVLLPGFQVTEGSEFKAIIGPCTAKNQSVPDSLKVNNQININ